MARTILVVDDDPDVRATLRALLVDDGYVVHTAADGREALEFLETSAPPGVILLDFIMPGMNGRQFLAAKHLDERWQAIPVVVLSAWTREWSGAGLGVEFVLPKPVDREVLLAVVRRFCEAGDAGIASSPSGTDASRTDPGDPPGRAPG